MSTFIFLLAIKYNFEPSQFLLLKLSTTPQNKLDLMPVINQIDKDEDGEIGTHDLSNANYREKKIVQIPGSQPITGKRGESLELFHNPKKEGMNCKPSLPRPKVHCGSNLLSVLLKIGR